MITGSAKIKADEKGRLAIPNRFRDYLSIVDGLILTCHPHGCLSLYAEAAFEKVKEKIRSIGNVGYMDAHLEEIVIGCAEKVAMDSAGRLLVQNHLRERAGLQREVLLFGVGESVRIWDEARWEQRNILFQTRMQEEGLSEPWRNLRI